MSLLWDQHQLYLVLIHDVQKLLAHACSRSICLPSIHSESRKDGTITPPALAVLLFLFLLKDEHSEALLGTMNGGLSGIERMEVFLLV